MNDEKRIVDHTPVIEAAREDAGKEGARMVFMTIGELWRLIHRAPVVALDEQRLAGAIKPR